MNLKKKTKKQLYKVEQNLRIENKIYSNCISIPNVVVNSNISIQAKYLYGIIANEHYYGGFTKSIIDISNILHCSISSSRKYIKELLIHNYVFGYVKGNVRHLVPQVDIVLISDNKRTIREEQHDRDFALFIERNKKAKELPQQFIDFLNKIV